LFRGETLGLFEESGLLLDKNERILKQGKCKGKVPKGEFYQTSRLRTAATGHLLLGLLSPRKDRKKVEWQAIDGELIITTTRGIALQKEGTIKKHIVSYDFVIVGASVTKPRFGSPKLHLLIDVDNPKSEATDLEVASPEEWVNVIKSR